MKAQVGVVGGGPWGVALAKAARRSGASVTLYTRRGAEEHGGIRATQDLSAVAEAPLLVLAVPTTAIREVAQRLGDHLDGQHLVVHGIRGLGPNLETISDILRKETPVRRLGALGGPVQVRELNTGRPSAMVCGSPYPEVCNAIGEAFRGEFLRVYTTTDLRGLEWGSAMVGALSIGVGFAEAAGAGPGLVAALISRAMEDAARLAVTAGADERTLLGLGGYGDLLASIALRDRPEVLIGKALAEGKSVEEAVAEAQLRVEGIALIPRLVSFARERRISAPTFDALASMLEGGRPEILLGRFLAA